MGFLDPHEHLDAVIANGGDDTLVVLFNYGTGSGTFDPPVVIPLAMNSTAFFPGGAPHGGTRADRRTWTATAPWTSTTS